MNHLDGVALTIVVVSFLIVTCIGFAAARWRPAEDPMHLNEWGLGGRGFGTFVSWFLLGGDIYTAYTFIAVPALVYAAGAAGFYALSYTIMVWPIVFVFGPRLWSVARARGYVSPGEFVRGRHGSQGLGLAVAATGILATMPYIALQLVGIESVLTVMGIGGNSSNVFVRDLPLILAFAVVSAYTYLAGLRAPALIAFVKDTLIYVTVIVAILVHPEPARRLGPHLRGRFGPPEHGEPGDRQAVREPRGAAGRPVGLRHPGARLGAGPVRLPARGDRGVRRQAARRDPAQRGHAARLHAGARADRAVRLHGAGGAGGERRGRGRPRQRPAVRAAAVLDHVPELVRGRRLRGHHHRRPGPGGRHVHRRGEPVHPDHLQGALPALRHARPRRRGWRGWPRC